MDRSLIEGIWIERICLFIFFYFLLLRVFFNYFYGFLLLLSFLFRIFRFLILYFMKMELEDGVAVFFERVQKSVNLITLGFVEEFLRVYFFIILFWILKRDEQ